MKNMKKYISALLAITVLLTFAGCSKSTQTAEFENNETQQTETEPQQTSTETATETTVTEEPEVEVNIVASQYSVLDVTDLFSKRDVKQTADTSDAKKYTVTDGQTITITEEGVYVLTGTASNAQIFVNADENAKVQLVLQGLNVTNDSIPVIYVKSADKVFVTTSADSTLAVTGSFTADGDTNTDGVIFSKEDLVLNGTATVTIKSSENGVVSKDDLKVTGGTYIITAGNHGLQGKDSILVYDGDFTIKAGKDGLHSGNDDDDKKGYIYIYDGSFSINASSDGIEAGSVLQIDGGKLDINAAEGLEATYVQVNGSDITIKASDDGINASVNSYSYDVVIEINGGNITINMGQGDTDAVDSNGKLIIRGGNIDITAQFAFDFDGSVSFTGGTVYVNGQQVTSISNSMMGPGGGPGGQGGHGPGRW